MGALTPRLKALAESIDAGGAWEKTTVGPSLAIRATNPDGSRTVVVLDAADRANLAEVLPILASALEAAAPPSTAGA